MALRVWLPLDGNLNNQGCDKLSSVNIPVCATVDASGKIGKCYTSTGANNGVTTDFEFDAATFSIAAWIRINTRVNAWRCPFKLINSSTEADYAYIGFGCEHNTNATLVGFHFYHMIDGTNKAVFDAYPTTCTVGEWTHFAVAYDGVTVSYYKNGVRVQQTTLPAANQHSVAHMKKLIMFGTDGSRGTSITKTSLNDVRIYDHCLSATEVKEIAMGLVLHYKLDLPNPNLLTGTKNFGTGWSGTGVTEHKAFENFFSTKTRDNTEGTGYSDTAVFNKAVVVYPGETYTASFWAKGVDTHNIICYFYDNTSGIVQVASGHSSTGATTTSNDGSLTFPITTEWKKYWCTWTFNNTANPAQKSLIIGRLAKGLGATSIAKVKLEKGDKATEWSYHVKDNGYQALGLSGSAELLSNNPSKITAWTADGATLTQVDNETISFTPTGGARRIYNGSSNVWLEKGAKYTFSCDAKADTNGRTLQASRSIANFATAFTLTTSWAHYVGNITINEINTGGTLSLQSEVGATISLKNMHLIKANKYIEDSSGYGHNGEVLIGIDQKTDSPRYNSCAHFSATNQKIKISGLTTSGFGSSYTFAWWGKCGTYYGRMMWGFSDGIRLNGIYNGVLWNTGDGSDNPLYKPGTTTAVDAPSVDEWHHFAMVGDGSTCKAYLDGELWGQAKTYKNISGTTIYLNGWNSDASYSNSDASLSDFRIYCTPLLDKDIKLLYNMGMRVDNLYGVHTFEFNESDNTKLLKSGQLQMKNYIEQDYLFIDNDGWSYNPSGNDNSTFTNTTIDVSQFYKCGIPVQFALEYDLSWTNLVPNNNGTFRAFTQGNNYNAANEAYDWASTNYFASTTYAGTTITSAVTNNSTGTIHVSKTITVPATWFDTYSKAHFGFRVDYATGTVTLSNLKVTLIADRFKINPHYAAGNNFIEI